MKWIGPFRITRLLDNMMSSSRLSPPEANSVYVISKKSWVKEPDEKCLPLYVGSNTGKSKRFRTRIGDLIADMFGFFGEETGHHSGGEKLYKFCKEHKINPKNLYIGWLKRSQCPRCDEIEIYEKFKLNMLNKNRPALCKKH